MVNTNCIANAFHLMVTVPWPQDAGPRWCEDCTLPLLQVVTWYSFQQMDDGMMDL